MTVTSFSSLTTIDPSLKPQNIPVVLSGRPLIIRELKINDAATPRRGVNMYDKKKVFWNLMSVTTV